MTYCGTSRDAATLTHPVIHPSIRTVVGALRWLIDSPSDLCIDFEFGPKVFGAFVQEPDSRT